jgi:hypothetical protein
MKKLLLSVTAIFALTFSVSAQNLNTHTEDFDSTAAEALPCFTKWAEGFTFPYFAGNDFTAASFNGTEKTMELDLTTNTDPSLHGPMYYQLSGGNSADCTPGVGKGLVDVTTENKFSIRMKSTVPVQVIVFIQEENTPSWNYSKFSNSNITANVTTEYQVFELTSILDSNQEKTSKIDLSQIGAVIFELGKTDGTDYDVVSGAKVSIDYIKFGAAVVGVEDVEVSAANVYPNPAGDVVNIALGSVTGATVELSDITGKVVAAAANASGNVAFNTVGVPAGLYVVSVKSDEGVSIAKVVIK